MRFICDAMLGKLVKYLRILGLDTIYITALTELNSFKSVDEPPYFFTKRKMQNASYKESIYIQSDNVMDQLKEIKGIIKPYINPETFMNRCIRCNTLLSDAKKNDIEMLVPEFVYHRYNHFKTCRSCKKIYWEGSHVEHMRGLVKEIIG